MAQLLRTLVTRADRAAGGSPSPADNADSAWLRAQALFFETGVMETLQRILISRKKVDAAVVELGKAIAGAIECGEFEVRGALAAFSDAMSKLPALDRKERSEHLQEYVGVILAHATASRHMLEWAIRRLAIPSHH
ncbi:MAG: hypothetical protein ACRENE_08550 [Polyangiaceae bacterium]